MNKLSHKGYTGSVEVSFEDNCLHGRVLFIDDIVTYEGGTVEDLATSFKDAVDRYIAYCEETGKPANKPYSGTFNVRVGEELHRKAAQEAYNRNITLNDYVAQAVKTATEQSRGADQRCLFRYWPENKTFCALFNAIAPASVVIKSKEVDLRGEIE